ncbi:DUF2264 domain-containing protein [Endozoicomonas sp. SCSIO W0465]|uniref:DUF2264 domain-containing protein n=1 Tax=Endozoicomonas sp. SCSIO W0465 TaxID=2918516 RepID=UPI002074F961|nr:DUF2264 domain-containing protein [Endozoicomonas sp. SCSIO W0465]USE35799.1 DUF2264 domain-containing protein [Endozoicomonas sp. SCSIO W0465]
MIKRQVTQQGAMTTLNGSQLKIPEIVKAAFLAGTDPEHFGYWGKLESYDQKICESADLALALWISKKWVWNTFTDNERKQVADWFLQVNSLATVDNNWHLFPLTVQLVLKSLTGILRVDIKLKKGSFPAAEPTLNSHNKASKPLSMAEIG